MARARVQPRNGYVPGHAYDPVRRLTHAQPRPGASLDLVTAPWPSLPAYRPRKVPPGQYEPIREQCVRLATTAAVTLGLAEPQAYELLRIMAGIALWWTVQLGQPWDPTRMLAPDQIDAYAASVRTDALSASSRQTDRAKLRRAAHALGILGNATRQPLGARRRQPPHTEPDRIRHYAAARTLPEPWRTDAVTLLDGVYNGLSPFEAEALNGSWITPVDGGCSIAVPPRAERNGLRPARTIEVQGPDGLRLAACAADRGPGLLIAGTRTARGGKAIEAVVHRLHRAPGGARFDTRRANSAWLVRLLDAGVPFGAVAQMAGWATGTKTPTDLLPALAPLPADRIRAHLRKALP